MKILVHTVPSVPRGLWMSLRLGTRAMRSAFHHWTSSLALLSSLPETSFPYMPPPPIFPKVSTHSLSTHYVLGAEVNGKCRGLYHLLQTPAGHPPARVCGVMGVKMTNGRRQAEKEARRGEPWLVEHSLSMSKALGWKPTT